jgi:hypothetical protein
MSQDMPPLPPPDLRFPHPVENMARYSSAAMYAYAKEHAAPLLARIAELEQQAEAFKTTMVAAAEEIAAHWEAHCDAEGYGPQNLLRRLEEGIPSEYGYTAGAFEQLRKNDARYRWLRDCLWNQELNGFTGERSWLWSTRFASSYEQGGDLDCVTQGQELDAAIDARLAEGAIDKAMQPLQEGEPG